MMIKIAEFDGMAPVVSSRLLKEKFATFASDCVLRSGALEPMRGLLAVRSLPIAPTSIYRYQDDHWFTFSTDVDAVRAPLPYDTTNRVIYTGVLYPRQTRNDIALGAGTLPNSHYRLGVPAPDTAPAITNVGAAPPGTPEADLLSQTVYYVYCFVTAWGEEGPPSPVSGPTTIAEGQPVTISLGAPPGVGYNFATGAVKRVYRSNSGSTDTAFQFLADVPIATATYVDSVPSDSLGEVIPSVGWQGPPNDDAGEFPSGQMKGVRALANGVLVGFSGNTLVYSQPYLPHAWSSFYPLKDEIVAIEVTSSGVLVATKDRPVIAMGLDPQAVSIQELDIRQACVSKRSMVDMGEYAIYASPDGLVGLESNGSATLLTKGLLSREQWQATSPQDISAYRWEDKYVAFIAGGGGFTFSPTEDSGTLIQHSMPNIGGGFYNADDDTLYVTTGTTLNKFGMGDVLAYNWFSKVFQLPEPASFSVLQVIADTYPVLVYVYRGGDMETATDIYSVPSDRPVRMKPGRSHNWQISLNGTNVVHSVAIAQSMDEIASG